MTRGQALHQACSHQRENFPSFFAWLPRILPDPQQQQHWTEVLGDFQLSGDRFYRDLKPQLEKVKGFTLLPNSARL